MPELAILVVTILLALGYAYSNGMNDAANAVATSISTRALKPMTAVMMAGLFNTAGAFTGSAVAKTIGKGVIAPELMTQPAVMAAIATAIIWVVFATRAGYPVSVSHALIAGVVGAGVAVSGIDGLNMTIVIKVLLALALSPLLGFTAGFIVMLSIYWLFRRRSLSAVNAAGRRLQILSTAFLSCRDIAGPVGILKDSREADG